MVDYAPLHSWLILLLSAISMGFGDHKFETLLEIKGCTKVRCGNMKEEKGKKGGAHRMPFRGALASEMDFIYRKRCGLAAIRMKEKKGTCKGWVALDNDTA